MKLDFSLQFNLPFIYWSWIEYKVFFSLSVTYLKRQQVQQNCTFRRFIALQVKYVVPRDLRKHLLWQKPLLETSYNNPFILGILLLWHNEKNFEEIFHFEETFPEKFILYSCCTLCLSWLMKVKIFTIFWVRKIRENECHLQTNMISTMLCTFIMYLCTSTIAISIYRNVHQMPPTKVI